MRRATLFGKLPAHGDFVSRGLEPRERDALDRWLSASMLDAEEAHGARFEALYGQAPPWRFALGDGAEWTAGAIAPSIDGAGRRFPLVVGYAGVSGGEAGAAAEHAEAVLYDALAGGWSADATIAALDAAEPSLRLGIDRAGWWTIGSAAGADGVGFAASQAEGERPPMLVRLMLTPEGAA